MQSSMLTYNRFRARSGSFSLTSGYWMVTAGVKRWLNVTFMPTRTVQTDWKISLKYLPITFFPRIRSSQHHPGSDPHDTGERPGSQHFPRNVHQLVDAQARKRPPEPHLHEDKEHPFRQEPEDSPERAAEELSEGAVPPSQENRGADGGDGEHIRIFREEKEGELHPAVFGVVPCHQLGLRLRDVKRGAVGFRERRDKIDQECDKHERKFSENEPVPEPPRLHPVDLLKVQGAGDHYHDDQREGGGDLITHDLRGGAHGPEERPLVVRRPARHENPHDDDRRHRDDIEEADADVVGILM